MSAQISNVLDSHIPTIVQLSLSLGIHITMGTDFREFKEICNATDGKSAVGPAFDIDEFDLSSSNSMWMIGSRKSGEVVHTQAMKAVDLSHTTLGSYFRRRLIDFRVGGYDLDLSKSEPRLTTAASQITGLITYHGDLWLKGGPDGVRGGCLATILARLMLILGLSKWHPEYMIGIQTALTSCRGLAAREGYMRTEQRTVLWHPRDEPEPIEAWLVWMTREEAEFNLSTDPTAFYHMLGAGTQENLQPSRLIREVA